MKRAIVGFVAAVMAAFFIVPVAAQWNTLPQYGLGASRGPGVSTPQAVGPCVVGQVVAGTSTYPTCDTPLAVANNRISKTANYTVDNADRGTFALGGNAFFTLTFNSPAGYDSDFAVWVTNTDIYTGSGTGRAKTLAIFGLSNRLLYPGQTVRVFNQNGAWKIDPPFQRWRIAQNVQLYANDSTGSDDNDCLSAAQACDKASTALFRVFDGFDLTVAVTVGATINVAAGTMSDCLHLSGPFTGGEGRAKVILTGAGSASTTYSCATTTAIDLYLGAVLMVQDMKITTLGGGGHAVSSNDGAKLILGTDIDFGSVAGSHIYVTGAGTQIRINGPSYNISGSAVGSHMNCNVQGECHSLATTITMSDSTAFTFTSFVNATDLATVRFSNTSFTVPGGSTVTGVRGTFSSGAVVYTGSGIADLSFFPGSAVPTWTDGSMYDGLTGVSLFAGIGDNNTNAPWGVVNKTDRSSGVFGGFALPGDYGWLQSVKRGTAFKSLYLQKEGGNLFFYNTLFDAATVDGGMLYYASTTHLKSTPALTLYGIVLGGGPSSATGPTTTAAMTNGQLLVGQTGAAPLPRTISGDCTVAASGAITCATSNGIAMPSSVTSGGIPYYSSTSAMASSALLTANGVVLGGGAGTAPTSTAAGTNGQLLIGQTSAAPTWNAMSGDATIDNTGALTIANDAVTNAKLANMANATFKCRTTGGTGDPEDCTASQANAILSPAWTTYTPNVVCGSGTITSFLTRTASYVVNGKTVQWTAQVKVDDPGTCATNVYIELPSTTQTFHVGVGLDATTGAALVAQLNNSNNKAFIRTTTVNFVPIANSEMIVSATYQSQ